MGNMVHHITESIGHAVGTIMHHPEFLILFVIVMVFYSIFSPR